MAPATFTFRLASSFAGSFRLTGPTGCTTPALLSTTISSNSSWARRPNSASITSAAASGSLKSAGTEKAWGADRENSTTWYPAFRYSLASA